MKINMKKIISLIFTGFLAASVFADGISMDSVFDSLTSDKVTTGNFVLEKSAAKLKRSLKSSGTFIFSDMGILWQTLRPFPSTMSVTESSIIQTAPDGTKTVIDGSSNEVFKTVAQTLSSLFGGSRENVEKYFEVKDFDSSASGWKLLLEPKDKTIAQALKTIELGGAVVQEKPGSSSKARLDSIVIKQSETETTVYQLSNQKKKKDLTDAEKAFFK